jgi:hypothetical protein
MPNNRWAISCLAFSACLSSARPIPHAPPEEAAKVQFPLEVPREGRRRIQGNMAAAIQLAMEDFLPPEAAPQPGPVVPAPCLYRRESYDVTAAPASEEVMLVRFVVNPGVCDPGESIVDVTTYAVDVRTMRVLALGVHSAPRHQGSP